MARVAFCQEVMIEYIGVMHISAYLKQAGHTVELFIDRSLAGNQLVRERAAFKPDLVGFSLLTPSVPRALAMAKKVKQATGALTICGGVHAILYPEIIEDEGVDIVCIGEGEYCMAELCNALDQHRDYHTIQDLWVKTPEGLVKNPRRPELVNLNEMPFHDCELYHKNAFFRRHRFSPVRMGKGYPFRCSFYSDPLLIGKFGKQYMRKMTPERAVAEIEHTVRNHPVKVKRVQLIDEVFWLDKAWLHEFLRLYKERIGLPYFVNYRFSASFDETDVQMMVEAGQPMVFVSVETGDKAQRIKVLNKPFMDREIIQVTKWFRKYGVIYGSAVLFGLPGDTVEDHVARLAFFRELDLIYLQTYFLQPYPGVAITEREDVQRYLTRDTRLGRTFHHDMALDVPDRVRLVNLKKVYFLCLRFPRLERPLVWLTQYRIPVLFDLLFLSHFTYYAFRVENLSLMQFLDHLRMFAGRQMIDSLGRKLAWFRVRQ